MFEIDSSYDRSRFSSCHRQISMTAVLILCPFSSPTTFVDFLFFALLPIVDQQGVPRSDSRDLEVHYQSNFEAHQAGCCPAFHTLFQRRYVVVSCFSCPRPSVFPYHPIHETKANLTFGFHRCLFCLCVSCYLTAFLQLELVSPTNCPCVNYYFLVMAMDAMQYLKESVLVESVFAALVVCYMRLQLRMFAQGWSQIVTVVPSLIMGEFLLFEVLFATKVEYSKLNGRLSRCATATAVEMNLLPWGLTSTQRLNSSCFLEVMRSS